MQIRRKLVPERRKSDPGPGPQKEATWKQPGPVAFDFHSDTITVPTSDMLNAMVQTTLVDDIYYGDPTTQDLEAHVARLGGHEAGLFMMSGTAGNMVALRSHLLFPPFSVLCDKRSHIAEWVRRPAPLTFLQSCRISKSSLPPTPYPPPTSTHHFHTSPPHITSPRHFPHIISTHHFH